jgi:adenosylmethionine-8-amino-7-oxononanoate aminotransferase
MGRREEITKNSDARGTVSSKETAARKGYFVTGTDTRVGKTVAIFVVAHCLRQEGVDVGVMKPIQCAGNDAEFLKYTLDIPEPIQEINPYFAREPLSPNVAFEREHKNVDIERIIEGYQKLKNAHDILLVEGAGGFLVPIKDDYFMADLVKDLDLEVIIVSRLGLGTINHTLSTIESIRQRGLTVKGVIFSEMDDKEKGVSESTNPDVIKKFGQVEILGTIPYLKQVDRETVDKKCRNVVNVGALLKSDRASSQPPWAEWDKKFIWHPFTQMRDWQAEDPLVIEKARGSYLIDVNGNRYLDGVSSLWVNVHGHRCPEIDQAIKNQIDRLSHSTLLGLSNTPAIKLAKKLIESAPEGLSRVFYSDNGSTAVEVAIKMAYQYWRNTGRGQKKKILHLTNSYHGDTLGSVSVGGIELFHKVYRDLVFETMSFDSLANLERLENLFKEKHEEIAAFIVEPLIQAAAGMLLWPKGILRKVRELCAEYDIFLICDEVATGFGRTGKMFACEHEDVAPDFLCLAKGLTGGYLPLAATLTSGKVYDGFKADYKDQKTFFHGHTYTGNPLGCAAALANLQVFEDKKVLYELQPKIKFLAEQLKMFYNLDSVGDVRQLGFMVGIELVKDRATKQPFPWEEKIGVKVCQKVRERGVILRPLGNVIVLMPPLAISVDELRTLLDVTYWAIDKITQKG